MVVELEVGVEERSLADALHELFLGPERLTGTAAAMRALAEALPVLVGVIGPDLCAREVFGGALVRFGVSGDDLVGLPVSLWGEVPVAMARRALEGTVLRFETEGRWRGRPYAFHNVLSPLPDGSGVAAVSIDVTDRLTAERALAESELRFRRLADAAPIGIYQIDSEGGVVYANTEAERQAGVPAGHMLGFGWAEVIHPDDLATVALAEQEFRAGARPYDVTHRLRWPDGTVRWIRGRAEHLHDTVGQRIGAVVAVEDITEQVEADRERREREDRVRAVFDAAAEGILTTDATGTVLEGNAAAQCLFGRDSTGLVGLSLDVLFDERGAQTLAEQRSVLGGDDGRRRPGPGTGVVAELVALGPEGSPVPVEVVTTAVTVDGQALVTHVLRDLRERQELEERLRFQATHDRLTGLPDRSLALAELERALTRAARGRTDVAVLAVQLGRLSVVSDSLGHTVAEELLVAAAERIGAVLEATDLLARVAGDGFVVVVEDPGDINRVVGRAASIVEALGAPFTLADDEAVIEPAVGVAYGTEGRAEAARLLGDAAIAAQRALEHDSPGYELFDAAMRAQVDRRRRTETDLRRGIERGELVFHVQPVVGVATGEIRGFEALARWERPGVGLVPPAEFIPVAEESGLILALGNHILAEASACLGRWQRRWPGQRFNLSVNLSARQLSQLDLPDRLAGLVRAHAFDPSRLILELTESVLLREVDAAARTLAAVKALGVRIAMDDFGTGYSSLTYLRRFPIDIVKVDRSFVAALGTDSRDSSIVDMVIALARSLGLAVVAEGVETTRQVEILEKLGCAYAQGFHYSPPVPLSEVQGLLDRQPLGLDQPGR